MARQSLFTTPRAGSGGWLLAAAAVSLVVSLTPWSQSLLYPFKLFTTWVHECGHALMTVLVGGSVTSITIAADTSGLTLSLIPAGRVSSALVASAGYLGAAIVGCLLMAATRVERWAHVILPAMGICMLITLIVWIRNLFGFVVVLAWAIALILLARRHLGNAARFLLSLLAVQVALNSLYDIRVLFLLDGGESDAVTMSRLFWLPPWAWATVWILASGGMLAATLLLTRGRDTRTRLT